MTIESAATLRAPLVVLAVVAVGVCGYLARDFLVPTAGGIVLALLLTPVADMLERARLSATLAAAASVMLMALIIAGLLALAAPSVQGWAQQAPYLASRLESKLEGLRSSIAVLEEMSKRVERATAPQSTEGPAAPAQEKVVVCERSLLGEIASTTPFVLLQFAYAAGLAFMLLAHRNFNRRQILRIARSFGARVRLARVMRAVYDRVGSYLFALTVIYSGVALVSAAALTALGVGNAAMWGAAMGIAAFIPFIGSPVVIALVSAVALLTFDDWPRILGVPAALIVIHVAESQFITPSVVGRRCALNTVAVFISIALLGWMWGAIGALVAVPLLILISTVAEQLPSMRWLVVLLADEDVPVLPPSQAPRRRRAKKKAARAATA